MRGVPGTSATPTSGRAACTTPAPPPRTARTGRTRERTPARTATAAPLTTPDTAVPTTTAAGMAGRTSTTPGTAGRTTTGPSRPVATATRAARTGGGDRAAKSRSLAPRVTNSESATRGASGLLL